MFMTCFECLQAVDGQENTYNIRAAREGDLRRRRNNPVVLNSRDQDIPLPNPTYLAIHASCCRVAHLSGAADYLDDTPDSDEECFIKVLCTSVEALMLSPAMVYYFIVYQLLLEPTLHRVRRMFDTQVPST